MFFNIVGSSDVLKKAVNRVNFYKQVDFDEETPTRITRKIV